MSYCQKSYCVFNESVPLSMYTFVIVVIIVIIIDNSMKCIFVFINQSYVLEDFLAV